MSPDEQKAFLESLFASPKAKTVACEPTRVMLLVPGEVYGGPSWKNKLIVDLYSGATVGGKSLSITLTEAEVEQMVLKGQEWLAERKANRG